MAASADTFVPLRPPVLGLVLAHAAASDRYRLSDDDGSVLAEGGLAECEQALVEHLLTVHGAGHPNLPLPTLGARQFWADVYWYAGWRIQENVLTGHHRLLDPDDHRRAWGGLAACRSAFEAERVRRALPSPGQKLVVLLHGLARHKGVWHDMTEALEREGYQVAALSYPSTRRSIAEHAAQLATLLDGLEGVTSVAFVTHSLGGLVARATLARGGAWRERVEARAVVMLAPPNQGSSLAEGLAEFLPFQVVLGASGLDIARLEALAIPAPDCPFGVITAGRGDGGGWNPWIDGDDDGVVGVDETALAGAADTLFVKSLHTFVMSAPESIAATCRFLATGHFTAAAAGDAPGGDQR